MSGENRRPMGWLLPVLVVAAGAYFVVTGLQNHTLSAVSLKAVNYVGLGLMAAGAVLAFLKKPFLRLAGIAVCVVGAILVIYL